MQETPLLSLGWGRPPGGGHGDSLQDSCLENPVNRGAWRAIYSPQCRRVDMTEETARMQGGVYRAGRKRSDSLCEECGWRRAFCERAPVHCKFSSQHRAPHEWEKVPRPCRETPAEPGTAQSCSGCEVLGNGGVLPQLGRRRFTEYSGQKAKPAR